LETHIFNEFEKEHFQNFDYEDEFSFNSYDNYVKALRTMIKEEQSKKTVTARGKNLKPLENIKKQI
jgi:hypothetical protein